MHSPEVLFLDEPTIGLDVVAQHNIQQFLKYYQEKRRITILLTSHYMKDVAALCKRVVVIAQGKIQYDGSLDGIIDQFSGSKIVTLQLADGTNVDGLETFGEILSIELPKVRFRVSRKDVFAGFGRGLATIFDRRHRGGRSAFRRSHRQALRTGGRVMS